MEAISKFRIVVLFNNEKDLYVAIFGNIICILLLYLATYDIIMLLQKTTILILIAKRDRYELLG